MNIRIQETSSPQKAKRKKQIRNQIIQRFIANTKVGDVLNYGGDEWTVTGVYPHIVRCVNRSGTYNTLSLGDLVMIGKEDSYPNERNSKTFYM